MTAKIKLNAASGGGSISIQAPSSSSNNRVIALPDIADGTIVTSQSTLDATKLSGNLPAISGAALTGIAGGISMIDTYHLTSNQSLNGGAWNYIKTNFTRANGDLGKIRITPLGTGLSVDNSGGASMFSYPSTGYYEVTFTTNIYVTTSSSAYYIYNTIWTSDDGSNYDNSVNTISNIYGNSNTIYCTSVSTAIIDVQNTSNDKFYLAILPETGATLYGAGDKLVTWLTVKKLAET